MHAAPKRLYDFPFSGNGYKVRLALAQLGIDVEHRFVDLLARETQGADFLAINPMGQIPVLELADGTLLRESNAILFWLTEGTPLLPADRLGRARVIQWMNFEQGNIDKVIGRARFLRRYPHLRNTTQADFDEWSAVGNRALQTLDAALENAALEDAPFLVNGAYSAADICIYGYVHCAEEGGFDLARYPAVAAWLDEVRRQPGHIPILG
jgi:glutathione S-transferase